MPAQPRFRRFGVGLALTLILAGICIVTAALVHGSWQRISTRNANDLVQEINTRIADTVAGNLQQILTNASASQEALRTIFFQDVIKIDNEAKREFVFLSLLQSQPSLSWIAFGWPDGHYFGARKEADDSIRMVEVKPDAEPGKQLRVDYYEAVVGDIQFLNRELSASTFLSSEQPWYREADAATKPVWTESEATPVGLHPAITFSNKLTVYGHYLGVMMVAIDLDRLARFLTALKVTRHGRAFILEPGDKVLSAASVAGGQIGWQMLADLKDPLSGALVAAMHQEKIDLGAMAEARNVEIRDGMSGVTHYVTFTPLPFRHWVVATVIPAEDILGDIPAATRRLYMMVIGLVAVVSGLGALVSLRLISRPMARIAGQMRQIERFHLDNLTYRPSRLRELDDLSRTLRVMGTGLAAFRKYLPADLVEILIREGIEAKPGGKTQPLTVLFTDLAGFTGLSEAKPEGILEILGDHLDSMSRIVAANGGTVDKFIGDSVMAFWNAPTHHAQHALAACTAALACRRAFLDSAEGMRAISAGKVGLRIGVNTGDTLVGNIGSRDRLNYTAIGDAVNVASRLESLNKHYGTEILIGEPTADAAGAALVLRRVDKVAVYGRRGGINVYELLGLAADKDALGDLSWVAQYDSGFERYLRRDWDGAMGAFREADRMRGRDEPARRMILRCRRYREQPPAADWDGTDTAESK